MALWRTLCVVCGLVLLTVTVAAREPADTAAAEAAVAAPEPVVPDPYVLLDNAKLKLGEGRLAQARELLKETPTEGTDPYIVEEILVQRLLVGSAFLRATHYLLLELTEIELEDTGYGEWLRAERDEYAADFALQAGRYLELTAAGPQLEFVRFRLPLVTTEHLTDLELYTDPEILGPAVRNWDDGREGLGKGLIAGQARVALVLAAVRHYDRESASPSLEAASERLRGGVPLSYPVMVDWLAETAAAVPESPALASLAKDADDRLFSVDGGRELYDIRLRPLEEPEETGQGEDPVGPNIEEGQASE